MKTIIAIFAAVLTAFIAAGCLPDGSDARAATTTGPNASAEAATSSSLQQQLLEQQKTIAALQEQMRKNAAALDQIQEQNKDLAEAAEAWAKRAGETPATVTRENYTYILNLPPLNQPAQAPTNTVVVEQTPPDYYGGYPGYWGAPVYYYPYYYHHRHHGYCHGGYARGGGWGRGRRR